jgi:glutaminyl-peptide cyclotransferase
VKTWTDTDSLYGTRHLAEKWEKDGTLKEDQSAHGDGYDRRRRPRHRARHQRHALAARSDLRSAAEREGYQSHFYARKGRSKTITCPS